MQKTAPTKMEATAARSVMASRQCGSLASASFSSRSYADSPLPPSSAPAAAERAMLTRRDASLRAACGCEMSKSGRQRAGAAWGALQALLRL